MSECAAWKFGIGTQVLHCHRPVFREGYCKTHWRSLERPTEEGEEVSEPTTPAGRRLSRSLWDGDNIAADEHILTIEAQARADLAKCIEERVREAAKGPNPGYSRDLDCAEVLAIVRKCAALDPE